MSQALICPQCSAPLSPSRFARSVTCAYCGTTIQLDPSHVPAARFHEAYQIWNSPQTHGYSSWLSLDEDHWAIEHLLGQGDTADVYAGRRARWPTEVVVLKVARDAHKNPVLENEWGILQSLQQSTAPGADVFGRLLPQPVMHGQVTAGLFTGRKVSIFRREYGFRHSLEAVMQLYPHGIPPRSAIWLWRRVLELLHFLHASGLAHGAVLPAHILVQEDDHGATLIGFGCAGEIGKKVSARPADSEAFYPDPGPCPLTPQLDLAMSARTMIAALGGDSASCSLPPVVPGPLAEMTRRIARLKPTARGQSAWDLREMLGDLAERVFGPPQFCPLIGSST
jgi:serine/threonine protein kinase